MNMDKILEAAIERDASDIHLICNNKPLLRISRELIPIEEMEVLTSDDMNEMKKLKFLELAKMKFLIQQEN